MPRSKKSANPFYFLLLVAGISFAITAVAYGVMALEEVEAARADVAEEKHPLVEWLNRHGNTALLAELAFLAVFTFAAIGTDDFWQRRAAAGKTGRPSAREGPSSSATYMNDQFSALVEEDRRSRPRYSE